MSVRVRFAPSPTGHLHIGGARTALFNWLLARQKSGTFILRVEDTDLQRSTPTMIEGILDGLRWLGLDWDEGPFFQSERLQVHRALCDRLLQSGHAYRDYSDPGAPPESYRRYREADPDSDVEGEHQPFAVRFKVPDQRTISFQDRVFGPVSVESGELADFVILRSDGMPTYHLSVVADDLDMRISHVIRGGDHLANTSKHVLIYQALSEPVPEYAHLPLILGPDRKRLSKRHGATSVAEYRNQGFLPEAMRNYLALLGWSPPEGEEKMTTETLIAAFDLNRVNRADAVFDLQKLEWLNGPFISDKLGNEIDALALPFLKDCEWWESSWLRQDVEARVRTLDLLKTKVKKLSDFPLAWRAFFCDDFDYDEEACSRFLSLEGERAKAGFVQALQHLADAYSRLDPFDLESTESELRQVAASFELKTGPFIGAVRIALAGRGVAPGIFDVIVTLGRHRTVERLRRMVEFLK